MRTKKGLIVNSIWILLGAVLIILSYNGIIQDEVYGGFGAGLVGVGIVQLIRSIRYKTNKNYKENVDIEIGDERNRYIRMKAWSYAGYFFVLICGVITIVCMILSQTLYMQMASYAICTILVLYWISYLVLKNKY